MQAILVRQFGGPEVLKLEQVPDPPAPGPGQVLIAIRAAGVNPVDTYVRTGTYAVKPELPYIPGSDAAGVVEAAGPGVTSCAAGDRVYTCGTVQGRVMGAYAATALCNAAQVYAQPENTTFAQGAALGVPYATAHRALFGRGGGRSGERVLIHGASGGVGTAAVQLARARGLIVVGTAGSEAGLAHVRQQGAHHAVSHAGAGYIEELKRFAPEGFDLIVEMLANVNLDRDLDLLARRGRVVVVGSRGRIEIDPRKTMSKDAAILGMMLFNIPPDELVLIHRDLAAGLASGELTPVIAHELPLAEAARAHELVMTSGARGKIVLSL
jgi:NADPH2:quinone reductase